MVESELVENWRDVVGYEGYYKVSDLGNVKSVHRIIWRWWRGRQVHKTIRERLVALCWSSTTNNRRLVVHLWKENKRRCFSVARLVLESFVGLCPEDMECCHYPDRDIANCSLNNLRWDTHTNNQHDKYEHGTMPIGEDHWNAKLNADDIRRIRKLHRFGYSYAFIAKRVNCSFGNVRDIIKGKTWSHIEDIDE